MSENHPTMSEVIRRTIASIDEAPLRVSTFRRFIRVFLSRVVVVFGLTVIIALILTAVCAPYIAPYDPYQQNLDNILSRPNSKHLLGTDTLGRDTLSRIIYGSRTSLMVGIVAIFIAAAIGMLSGLIAGYFGGMTNMLIMRFIDALMSFPMILLALTIAAILGAGRRVEKK